MADLAWIGNGDIPPDVLLRLQHQVALDEGMKEVVVISVRQDDDLNIASSGTNMAEILFLIEQIKYKIVGGDYV